MGTASCKALKLMGLYFVFGGLFYYIVTISDCIMSKVNSWINGEFEMISKKLLSSETLQSWLCLQGRGELRSISVNIHSDPTDVQTGYLPNTSLYVCLSHRLIFTLEYRMFI